jgi:hypothetical protein
MCQNTFFEFLIFFTRFNFLFLIREIKVGFAFLACSKHKATHFLCTLSREQQIVGVRAVYGKNKTIFLCFVSVYCLQNF